jgi:hypothetical protein
VQKQVKVAFASNACWSIEQCIVILSKEHFNKEISVWITPFEKLGKGKTNQPNNFTVCVQELLAAMESHDPKVHASAHVFDWVSLTGFQVKSFLQKLSKKGNTPLTTFTSHTLPSTSYSGIISFSTYSGILWC